MFVFKRSFDDRRVFWRNAFLQVAQSHSAGHIFTNLCLSRSGPPHPVLDVVVDDEVQLFVGEPVVFSENAVNFVDDRLGRPLVKLVVDYPSSRLVTGLLALAVTPKLSISSVPNCQRATRPRTMS